MASSSESEDTDFINTDIDDASTIYHDAKSSLSDLHEDESFFFVPDLDLSLPSKISTRFITIPLTENQLNDLACRDKLERFRAKGDLAKENLINSFTKESEDDFQYRNPSLDRSNTSEARTDRCAQYETLMAPDLLKDHIRNISDKQFDKTIKSPLMTTNVNETGLSSLPHFQHQRSLPYPTIPSSSSTRNSIHYFSRMMNLSAMSEPNIVDIDLNDFENGNEDSINRRKFPVDDLFKPFMLNNFDHDKYVRSSDANPMTQTLLERAKGTNTLATSRQNSSISNTYNHQRRNSLDQNSIDTSNNLESSLNRRKYGTKIMDTNENDDYEDDDDDDDDDEEEDEDDDDDDDNESTTSESSSTRSSHTTVLPSPSTLTKSSRAAIRAASLLFRGGKRQLTRLMSRSFLRKNVKKTISGNQQTNEVEDDDDDAEKLLINDGFNGDLKYKSSRILKDQTQFDKTQLLQTIVNAHNGPIWCMKFSPDGHLLATGGQDKTLKIWVLKMTSLHFNDLSGITSNLSKQQNDILSSRFTKFHHTMLTEPFPSTINTKLGLHEIHAPLYSRPFCQLAGHQAPVLDVAWSKSWFLLSSSMDKTVRLWHLSRSECLCAFRHVDFVSSIAFHPRDDRYFVSASLDGHVRLWNIPNKRVVYWALIPAQRSSLITAAQANLITSLHFCDEGRKVTVGTFDGRFLLYTDSLEYETVMNIGDRDGSRNHRSRKKCRKPYKITGIEPMNSSQSRVLITSNDSRIRLYDTRSREIERKYRGYSNQSSQIRASFSHDDLYIISGSEDGWFYVWRTETSNSSAQNDNAMISNGGITRKQQRQCGRAFERIRVHNTMVTSAIFTPNPNSIMDYLNSSMALTTADHPSMIINRSHVNNHSQNTHRPIPPTMGTITPMINNHHRTTRLICTHAPPSPSETSMTSSSLHANTYFMVTADAKGQMKFLVNRLIREKQS